MSSLVPAASNCSYGSPSAVEPIRTGRLPVGVGVHDELRAAVQRRVGHRVEVADDDVGLEAELEQRVGAAVDADRDGLDLPQVAGALQGGEVLAVVDAPHHDEGVAALERRAHVGQVRAVGGQVVLALQVLEGVGGEPLELGPEGVAGLLDVLLELVDARGGRRWPAAPRPATPRRRRR